MGEVRRLTKQVPFDYTGNLLLSNKAQGLARTMFGEFGKVAGGGVWLSRDLHELAQQFVRHYGRPELSFGEAQDWIAFENGLVLLDTPSGVHLDFRWVDVESINVLGTSGTDMLVRVETNGSDGPPRGIVGQSNQRAMKSLCDIARYASVQVI